MIEQFNKLATAIAPEWHGYVLMQPHELPCPRDTSAYCILGRNIRLRDYLTARGEWRGWLPCLVVVEETDDLETFLGLLLHELSHALPFFELEDIEPTAADRAMQDLVALCWEKVDPYEAFAIEPWLGHEWQFLRRCLHLIHRAALHGVTVPLPAVFDAGRYGLSGLWHYRNALGDEPQRLLGADFSTIETAPAPEEFTALWVADVERWHKYQKEKQKWQD